MNEAPKFEQHLAWSIWNDRQIDNPDTAWSFAVTVWRRVIKLSLDLSLNIMIQSVTTIIKIVEDDIGIVRAT